MVMSEAKKEEKSVVVTKDQESGIAPIHGVVLGTSGLTFTEFMDFEKWQEVGVRLRGLMEKVQGSMLWWIGDWLNHGEQAYGEKYSQALEETDYKVGTLRNAAYVASKFPVERRRDNLTFSHHQEVASLDEKAQEAWLNRAEKDSWSVKAMRESMNWKEPEPKHECTCTICGHKHKAKLIKVD